MPSCHATPSLLAPAAAARRRARSGAFTAALRLLALLAAAGAGAALAAGPVGPVGPVGPIGPSRPAGAAPVPLAPPPAAQPAQGRASPAAGNRIEVTGNHASGTACAASVNSIDVQGARLDGHTVVVQGRNTNNARTGADCTAPAASGAAGTANSIRIR